MQAKISMFVVLEVMHIAVTRMQTPFKNAKSIKYKNMTFLNVLSVHKLDNVMFYNSNSTGYSTPPINY